MSSADFWELTHKLEIAEETIAQLKSDNKELKKLKTLLQVTIAGWSEAPSARSWKNLYDRFNKLL